MTGQIPNWWEWGYWVSPMSYGYNAFTVNELFAPRWMNKKVYYSDFLFCNKKKNQYIVKGHLNFVLF